MEPLVSVIIPNYNHARFLNQRIDSVLNQTYKNYEIIILDDKSKDNSIDVIKQFEGNERITHIIINEENSGSPFKQWQKGFELAKGELIWIAESDDACENTLLEVLVNEFLSDSKCVVAFCKSIMINSNGFKIGERGMENDFHMDGLSFFNKYLYKHCYIGNASSAIFKKEVLKRIDLEFTKFRGCGDWVFWIEVSRCGMVAYNNNPLNYFRIHESNTTTQEQSSGNNETEVLAVYHYMQDKKYISFIKMLRQRIAHIFSIRYGKLHGFFNSEKEKELLREWKEDTFIRIISFSIYLFQKLFGCKIIRR